MDRRVVDAAIGLTERQRVGATIPPMGWNSWDCFGTSVTEDEVLANARVMSERLLAAGWDTIVVDIAWYDPTARSHGYNEGAPIELDGFGRQQPALNRFPSAADGRGFATLADEVHRLGLRFGLHVMRGIPRLAVERDLPVAGTVWTAAEIANRADTCAWNPDNFGLDHSHPGAQAYYDAQVAMFAQWGVDYIKADDMLAPYQRADVEAYAQAITRSGRDITLSLSPGTHLSTRHVEHLRENADLWRISDDLWDRWDDVRAQFARLARWATFQGSGGWADADMLPLGRIGLRAERGEPRDSLLTASEQLTLLTLWAMGRSPLMLGGDLPSSSPALIEMLANPALRAVTAGTVANGEVIREPVDDGELIVWTADGGGSDLVYVAIFWTGAAVRDVSIAIGSVVPSGVTPIEWVVRDLWAGEESRHPGAATLQVSVPGHGVRWFAFTPVASAR